ncbi:MAG: hypothetical protein ACBR13_12475 [Microcoleus sp.]
MPKKIEIEKGVRKINTVPRSHGKTPDFRELPLFSSAIAAPTADSPLTTEDSALTTDLVSKKFGISQSELKKCTVGRFLELNNWVILHKGRNSWRVINA